MISLNKGWILTGPGGAEIPLDLPNDVHSALLEHGLIKDPYWRDRETELDWIHQADWVLTKTFEHMPEPGRRYTLSLDRVDCVASVDLNGQVIANIENAHMRHDLEITGLLVPGENRLGITLHSNSHAAAERAAKAPFSIPYSSDNNRIPHVNFLRKASCHAGWDWNIALMPLGVYGGVTLYRHGIARLDEIKTVQRFDAGLVHLDITAYLQGFADGEINVQFSCNEQTLETRCRVRPGSNSVTATLTFRDPELWWPAGYGRQSLQELTVTAPDRCISRRIGFRKTELDTTPDEIGNRFAFRVNGKYIPIRGANWIPADALPARITPEVVRDKLQSARDAHMNMLRIWGGGQYEPDWFYDLCDEMGIMLWQDFMFACNIYPGYDRKWLASVRTEAVQQVRRLSTSAALALWCGDNELVGALGWFPETRENRDRYLAMYDRLNSVLEDAVLDEGVDVPWWPSSPSLGRLNFGDGWHVDTAGDMHFWDVWHSAKDFEHYRSVRPRFASEFGFQSLPPMPLIETFTEPDDRNISSRVMDVHQRNHGGNARIVETLSRYFRFPDSFESMLFHSRLSQALAMKTAIEFWRAQKPRNMGVLYWQLNDCWPVASWSSLDYGGGWKPVHYLARGFLAPVLVTAQPDGDMVRLYAINDTTDPVLLKLAIRTVCFDGTVRLIAEIGETITTDAAVEIFTLRKDNIPANSFLHFNWQGGGFAGENEFLTSRPKLCQPGTPEFTITECSPDGFTLASDIPALFVTVNDGQPAVLDHNCLTLLPGYPRRISVVRARGSEMPAPISIQSLGRRADEKI